MVLAWQFALVLVPHASETHLDLPVSAQTSPMPTSSGESLITVSLMSAVTSLPACFSTAEVELLASEEEPEPQAATPSDSAPTASSANRLRALPFMAFRFPPVSPLAAVAGSSACKVTSRFGARIRTRYGRASQSRP